MTLKVPKIPKRVDIAGFVNTRVIRDDKKRQVFANYEPQRYEPCPIYRNPAKPILWPDCPNITLREPC